MTDPERFRISREMLNRYYNSVTSRSYTLNFNEDDEPVMENYFYTGLDRNGVYFFSKVDPYDFIDR